MAAPAVTPRQTPAGTHLFDGHPARVVFQLLPDANVWEKSVKPSGVDGRDPVDQTTMWNVEWTTQTPRKLRSLMPVECTCAYDPGVFADLNDILNVIQSITVEWSDTSKLTFWGFLQKFELSELTEGQQPEMVLTIMPANLDPAALSGRPTEEPAVLSNAAGTADAGNNPGGEPLLPIAGF